MRGEDRVSRGQEGDTTKQSSMSGSCAPSVNGVLAAILGKQDVVTEVGMPSLTGRYSAVHNVTSVPSIVGLPDKLKYLLC